MDTSLSFVAVLSDIQCVLNLLELVLMADLHWMLFVCLVKYVICVNRWINYLTLSSRVLSGFELYDKFYSFCLQLKIKIKPLYSWVHCKQWNFLYAFNFYSASA